MKIRIRVTKYGRVHTRNENMKRNMCQANELRNLVSDALFHYKFLMN